MADSLTRADIEKNVKFMQGIGETFDMQDREFAKLIFGHYRNLIAAGFTATQALEIIKARGIS